MPPDRKSSTAVRSFTKQLKWALKKYHDPQQVGKQSPLAAPYFLGSALGHQNGVSKTSLERGEVLCTELRRAGDALWSECGPGSREEIEEALPEILQQPGSDRYGYLVLELRYFRHFFKPRRMSDIWEQYLGESRAEFYRDLDEAIRRLGEILIHRLQPTFRLEQPVLTTELIGRESVLQACLDDLQTGQAVFLSGPGGIGKTTLGTAVAAAWPTKAVFWFTVRPTLNDQLPSLLFSLGYFLYQQGASGLWQKLVADGGKIDDLNLALGLVRHDLDSLQDASLLLCFDEFDRLHSPEVDNPVPAHESILAFLDGLRGLVPMLFIGQQAVLDADAHYALAGLTPSQMDGWLTQMGIPHAKPDVATLHEYTHGNPRLLQLCLAMYQKNHTLMDILTNLPQTPALQPVFKRLWQRISAGERRLLQALSIFRSPAPADAWLNEQDDLERLVKRHLIQQDEHGGITLWPALRDLVYMALPVERREQLHLAAAGIRVARGEYTAAAYHLWQGGSYKQAIQVWYPHRQQEIERGQGSAALVIFEQISLHRLGKKERQALALLRAELRRLSGELQKGLDDLKEVKWPPNSELSIRARTFQGNFLSALGYADAALESYEAGLSVITRILNQLVYLRHQRSRVYMRQRRMPQAWREARLAQYEAENLQGLVQAEQGHYADAYVSYHRALALAQSLEYDAGIARTHRDLVAMLMRQQGKLDQIVAHAEKAITYFERIGDQLNKTIILSNLSGVYNLAQQFDKAVRIGAEALPFFEHIKDPYFIGVTAANIAEAYLGLNDLEQARHYAHYVLKQEVDYVRPYGLYTLSLVERALSNYDKAIQLMTEACHLAEQNSDTFMVAYAQRSRGEIYLDQQDVERSRQAFGQAKQLFESLGMADEVAETESLLRQTDR